MADTAPGPVLRRRQVGGRLRALRESTGKSLEEVAAYVECSPAKLSRIETGRTTARVADVRSILDLYGIGGSEREQILDLVREGRQPGWWRAHGDAIDEGMDTFIGLLDSAAVIDWYEPYLIPGLLQTRDYAHASLAHRTDYPDERVDRIIALRMDMQNVLTRQSAPAATFYLEESILHRPAGSRTVLHEQLGHLVRLCARAPVTVRVVPTSVGITAPHGFMFILLSYPDPAEPATVITEQFTAVRVDNRPEHVARYTATLESLRHDALDPDQSLTLITDLIHQP